MRVYHTTYDGYYITVKDRKINVYEGNALLPVRVQNWLKKNKPIELNNFHHDAIAYGYCK